MNEKKEELVAWILKLTVGSLAAMVLVMVFALVISLFVPNDVVDNKDVFPIIGPAFNTVIGAFVGLLGGLSLNTDKKDEKKEETPPEPEAPEPVKELVEEVEDHIA